MQSSLPTPSPDVEPTDTVASETADGAVILSAEQQAMSRLQSILESAITDAHAKYHESLTAAPVQPSLFDRLCGTTSPSSDTSGGPVPHLSLEGWSMQPMDADRHPKDTVFTAIMTLPSSTAADTDEVHEHPLPNLIIFPTHVAERLLDSMTFDKSEAEKGKTNDELQAEQTDYRGSAWHKQLTHLLIQAYTGLGKEQDSKSRPGGWMSVGQAEAHTGETPEHTAIQAEWWVRNGTGGTSEEEGDEEEYGGIVFVRFDLEGGRL